MIDHRIQLGLVFIPVVHKGIIGESSLARYYLWGNQWFGKIPGRL